MKMKTSNEELRLTVAAMTHGKVMLTDEEIMQARQVLDDLEDIRFGTIRGKIDTQNGVASVLAINNTQQGNGDFRRYVDHLKAHFNVVVFQCVMNERLRGWLKRNGFMPANGDELDFVWQKETGVV
jgi:hypothetical protein